MDQASVFIVPHYKVEDIIIIIPISQMRILRLREVTQLIQDHREVGLRFSLTASLSP